MSLCLIPECLSKNSAEAKFCQKCGSKLLLQDRYRGIKIIGQGGFGKTFLAVDEAKPSKPYCVIKQFLPVGQEPEYLEKASKLFKREAERLDELGDHPQIPELLSYCNHENRQYLVQEYINGKNLAEELAENGVFNEREVRDFLLDILQILQFIHSKQVIHRDIKPENIIRRVRDNKLVLVDFGASKEFDKSIINYTSCIVGTAQYAAPEQMRGESGYSSDLYSLGVTCLHLITNINPFDLFSTVENDWVWREYLAANNLISDDLARVLDKLVQQAVKKRYKSVEEVLADLNPRVKPVKSTPTQSTSSPPPPVSAKYSKEIIQANPEKNSSSLPKQIEKRESNQLPVKFDWTMIIIKIITGYIAIPLLFGMLSNPIAFILVGCISLWCRNIAIKKKRDGLLWFFLGVPFNIFALLVIAVLPSKSKS